jgi:hypothetical protein
MSRTDTRRIMWPILPLSAELLDVGLGFFAGDVNILANLGDCLISGLHIDDEAFFVGSREPDQ